MNRKKKALLVGNSHIQQIERAYFSKDISYDVECQFILLNDPKYAPWVERKSAIFLMNEVARQDIEGAILSFNPDIVCLSLGGNEHFIHVAANDPRPFDFYLPDRPDLAVNAGYELVSYGLMKAMLEHEISDLYDSIRFILETNAIVCCLGLPPVPEDNSFFFEKLGPDMKAAAEVRGVPYSEARYKMWRLGSDILRDWAHRNGTTYLPPAQKTMTPNGFILEELRGDAFHGSVTYATIVLEQVSGILK